MPLPERYVWHGISIPLSAQHFEYSSGYSVYIPCRHTATWVAASRLWGLHHDTPGPVSET
eukprot:2299209-Pyramimonas_sp.AAC.1